MSKHINHSLLREVGFFASISAGGFVAIGYPFFKFCTYAGKKKSSDRKKISKKWFKLKHTEVNHPRYRYEKEYEETKAWCLNQPMKDWYIRSAEGLKLHASYYPCEHPKRIVLMCHGYRGTRFGSVAAIAKYLHEHDSSLLLVDQRCCGESEGKYITFGAREQYDMLEWIGRLNEENVEKLPIYLYGQSMGATSLILAAGHALPKEVKGLIADCAFHSMKQQLRDIASGWFHLHYIELLLLRVDLFCRIFAGFAMKETDTSVALEKNRLPILFFHGEDDTYVWPENTMKNFHITKTEKELHLIPEARHLCCYYTAPQYYEEKVMEFFGRCE